MITIKYVIPEDGDKIKSFLKHNAILFHEVPVKNSPIGSVVITLTNMEDGIGNREWLMNKLKSIGVFITNDTLISTGIKDNSINNIKTKRNMIRSGQNMNDNNTLPTYLEVVRKKEDIWLQAVSEKYGEFLSSLGYDWENDPNMKETPKRVAKMYLKEIGVGSYVEEPKMTAFPNSTRYTGIIFQEADVKSLCSHHMMPFAGKAYVAYLPKAEGKVIGLSKINRVVDWFARRPQLQENLTKQIHDYIASKVGESLGVAVYIEASHTCVSHRGVNQESTMRTNICSGNFLSNELGSRDEFMQLINQSKRK